MLLKYVNGYYLIGLDLGYSAVKLASSNKFGRFPNSATPLSGELEGENETDIIVRDASGTYAVGETALLLGDGHNLESMLYNKNRYGNDLFNAIIKAGLAIALKGNKFKTYNSERIVVLTGLPPAFYDADKESLINAIAGAYDFDLKVGYGRYEHFSFTIHSDDVCCIKQPVGSMISCSTNQNFSSRENMNMLKNGKILVLDPGFHTTDFYELAFGHCISYHSFDTLGMQEIYRRTIEHLKKEIGTDLTVFELQRYLETGTVNAVSFVNGRPCTKPYEFGSLLENYRDKVCDEVLLKIHNLYNDLTNHNYLIVTGGTGDAWFDRIRDYYSALSNLTVYSANRYTPELPNTFSNVRGYYIYLYKQLIKQMESQRQH